MMDEVTLPNGWVVTALENICDVLAGNPAPQDEIYFENGESNFVRVQDMGRLEDSTYLSETKDRVNTRAIQKLRLFPKGSVLFTKSGASTLNNQRAILGKESYVVSHIAAAIPNDGILSEWVYFSLVCVDFADLAHSSVMPSLPLSKIKPIPILVPPTNEQHRIVAKIEELFSELDKGIENLRTAQSQLKVYRQALLKHAFEGKLTAQWRKENKDKLEPTEVMLKRIQQEREHRYQQQLSDWQANGRQSSKPKVPKSLPPLTAEELAELPELPEEWGWVKLSSISTNIQIGPFGSLLHKSDYVSNAIPILNPSHIKDSRIIPDWDLTVDTNKIKELSSYILRTNDLILGRRGEMGRCAVIRDSEAGWLCGTGSLFVRLVSSLKADFYCHILSSKRSREYLSSSSIGTTMQNLNQEILHGVPVPFCNVLEQEEILRQIEQQFSIIDRLDQTIITSLQQSKTLRRSILKKAFSGQLVPQDPHDEPASELMTRIQREKAETANLKWKNK